MTRTERFFSRLVGVPVQVSKYFWPLQLFFAVAAFYSIEGDGMAQTGDFMLGAFIMVVGMLAGASMVRPRV